MKTFSRAKFGVWFGILFLTAAVSGQLFAQEDSTDESEIQLSEIVVCTGVEDRQPVDPKDSFSIGEGRVYCFTSLKNSGSETTIVHEWYLNDELLHAQDLKVGTSKKWRTWSYKTLYDGFEGDWKVVVKVKDGAKLGEKEFSVK